MTLHDDEARLYHMLEHSREALEMLRDRTREELESDRQLNNHRWRPDHLLFASRLCS
jgi:hypothetical protein